MIGGEDILLLIGRFMLAVMFAVSAFDKFRRDPAEMRQIAALGLPAPAILEWLTGLFEIVAALALVFGIYARIAAVLLALFVVLASLLFVRFWSFEGPIEIRALLRSVFFGNVAVVGGLIYVATLGPGQLALMKIW